MDNGVSLVEFIDLILELMQALCTEYHWGPSEFARLTDGLPVIVSYNVCILMRNTIFRLAVIRTHSTVYLRFSYLCLATIALEFWLGLPVRTGRP